MTACGGKAKHSPRVGEYGQVLSKNIVLSKEAVQGLNLSEIKPYQYASKETEVGIDFVGESKDNPYRFVVVIQGTAIDKGKVDVGFMYGVGLASSGQMKPKIMNEEDNSTYKAGEPVLLVVASDPFSVAAGREADTYVAYGLLNKRTNIDIQSVELQIWQGKGKKYSSTAIASFVLLLIGVLYVIYRMATIRR